ncbi:N-acetylmuramyl-L-alanine amidase, negative regulator of AmpC, AmpD [beta proteobacterium KB13]|uniref:1,6-anhydro-N-acetylmuramyl-L-alanine amidase AmpD n=1 Tax=beta proteobacterium KB13 TaxID=314607 RepID=B6BVD5_9PROT|nr:N-acetylmuramyl-L-alanine amidase, negative regulator of AmpC, AmpD [beta proteobacterium KB13]
MPPGIYNNNYIEDFFQNQLDIDAHPYFKEIKDLKVSAHFLIKRNGELIQFVSCNDRAWHAGESSYQGKENCNDFSIGIELEGDDETPFEDDQYIKLIELLGCLKKNTISKILLVIQILLPAEKLTQDLCLIGKK